MITDTLDAWQAAINAGRPADVAALFTEDAVFQGLRPWIEGRAEVEKYYASQPAGMTVTYRLLRTLRLSDDAVVGWLAPDFAFPDRDPVLLNLTVVLRRTGEGWRIAHYHVSPRIG